MYGRAVIVWTQKQDETIKTMRMAGATFEEIAVELNKAVSTVHNRLRWISMTPEQRQIRAQQIRERKRKGNPKHPYLKGMRIRDLNDHYTVVPCPKALAERDWRAGLAPRDLTAALCGDPLPGMSALDRR